MGFNDWSEWPRQIIRINALADTAKTVSADPIKISGILVSNQEGTARLINFRDIDNDPEHFNINIAGDATVFFPIHVELAELEVITGAGADVDITFFCATASRSTTVI